MSVLIDTPVWSALLRRPKRHSSYASEMRRLVEARSAKIIGPIRQELLSRIRERSQFERIRDELRSFPDVLLSQRHFERAAECCNLCRMHGVQGSGTDFLLCAVAQLERLSIFTTDADFQRYARYLSIRFHPLAAD
jgi:hypothetical protein